MSSSIGLLTALGLGLLLGACGSDSVGASDAAAPDVAGHAPDAATQEPDAARPRGGADTAGEEAADAPFGDPADVTRDELGPELALADVGGVEGDATSPADRRWLDRPEMAPLGWNALACDHAEYWPNQLGSETLPLIVHFAYASQAETAAQALTFLEAAWAAETEVLGFSPPLDDSGVCGPDGRFDVFLWEGQDSAWVEALADAPETPHDDWKTYMVVDPWGDYGGEVLGPTLAHELAHACQATDDWWDIEMIYEATSTFVEALLFPDDLTWSYVLADFQAHADWSLDRNDDYETWYMYGGALYLHWLTATVFEGDPAWIGSLWAGMRNPPGANEPDFEDSLNALLKEEGGTFVGTVAGFAAWRWDPPAPFDGYGIPLAADVPAKQTTVVLDPAPMVLGTVYARVKGAAGATLTVGIDGDAAVAWAVRTTGAQAIDPTLEPATFGADGTVVLAVTALPLVPEEDDPDGRTDARFGVTLLLDYGGGG